MQLNDKLHILVKMASIVMDDELLLVVESQLSFNEVLLQKAVKCFDENCR